MSKPKISYQIVSSKEYPEFQSQVSILLNEGWILAGGISIIKEKETIKGMPFETIRFSQALTRINNS